MRSRQDVDEGDVVGIARRAGLDADALAERLGRTEDGAGGEDDNPDADTAGLSAKPVLYARGSHVTSPPRAWHLSETLTTAIQDDQQV
ncbi:hypothetical protein [Streptomyces sp. BRB081]|uniref:hypothetical protein n=1 Tax=Streptomyces sp. BRB081 TaxID=2769544 RepID=UPI0018ACED7B|nr:hypothetical protein [Streptomyces sp. BRB081]MBL3803096.1 hypothetical protein [Streptomyces sp. BRB081]